MLYKVVPIPYLKKELIYKSNSEITKGDIVVIEIGKRKYLGLVIQEIEEGSIKLEFEVKEINEIIVKNFYNETDFNFFKKFAAYNIINYGFALSLGVPSYIEKISLQQEKEAENIEIKEIKLTEKQSEIYHKININNGFKVNLLHGITGSGKTAIYLKIVQDIIQSGKQVLILVPQIILSHEIAKNIKKLTNIEPIIWHSKITTKNKKKAFSLLLSDKPAIFIGARSAFLLPYRNLGLIVIDEEHDESYKQNEIPVYNARDMAILYSNEKNIPMIIASATPSVESIINIERKGFIYHYLNERFYKDSEIPKVELIKHFPSKTKIFNDKTLELIKEEIKNGGQILIFLNRRGYARSVYCKSCNEQPKCDNCDNLLSFHKVKNLLKCHYCGHVENFRKVCKKCLSEDIIEYGSPGVEKVKEIILSHIEQVKIAVISSDTITQNKDTDSFMEEIRKGDYNVLIGTEIISKGYHFPNLNFVCILDPETGSLDGDFRYNERLLQLIIQLIGRAGRESNSSRVAIQTADLASKILKFAVNNDIHGFYKFEIENRKKFGLPPFSSFISIMIFSEESTTAMKTAEEIKKILVEKFSPVREILIFGPSEAAIKYMKRFYRYKILLQFPRDQKISALVKNTLQKIETKAKKTFIKIDVDPLGG